MLEPHPPSWQTVQDPVSWIIALAVLTSITVLIVLLALGCVLLLPLLAAIA